MVTLVQPFSPQPLFDSFISHVDAVDVKSSVRLSFEPVLFFGFCRIPDIGWVFGTALEFHSDDCVGESLGPEDLHCLFDGFYTDTDVIRMCEVLRVDQRWIGWVGGSKANCATGEMVLMQQEKTGIRVRLSTKGDGLSRWKVSKLWVEA